MKKYRQDNGAATLFVLIAMLFFSMYLIGMYLLTANMQSSQVEETQVIKEIYEEGINNIDEVYENLVLNSSKLTEAEKIALENNRMEEKKEDEITNENLKDNDNIKAVIGGKGKNEEVPIPEGFDYNEGETNTGVVITAKGSEFVWVPVPEISEMAELQEGSTVNYQGVLYDFSGEGDETIATKRVKETIGGGIGYREPDVVTDCDGNTTYLGIMNGIMETNYANANDFKADLQIEYNKIVESVRKYKGFYVGRYETSIDLTTKTAYSKAGVVPATAATNSGNMWYGLYAYQKIMAEKNGYGSVESQMICGSQQNAMLRWALKGVDKAKVTAKGNAPHNLSAVYNTGTQTNDVINNIYDLEGNGIEYTTEAHSTCDRSDYGGYCSYSLSPADRNYNIPNDTDNRCGTRISLYIKNNTVY